MEAQHEHSPLGASGAERWMNCPGSVALIKEMALPETDEPDYRLDGTVAHAGASMGLESGQDAWELIGEVMVHGPQPEAKRKFTDAMSGPVQVYLDYCRGLIANGTPDAQSFVEHRIHDPGVHPDFYGRCDFALIDGTNLHTADFKYGMGIAVEALHNPQLQYYAYGMVRHPAATEVATVTMTIVQPRIPWHPSGIIRTQSMSREGLELWAAHDLVLAMRAAERSDAPLDVGEHCRFCPAKLVCPALRGAFAAMAEAGANNADQKIGKLTDDMLGLEYKTAAAVSLYIKAVKDEALRRALHGAVFETFKLVRQKSNRVWKDGAEARFVSEFGDKVLSKPEFVGPAAAEKISSAAKDLVKEWAFTPDAGYTLAPAADSRAAVTVQTSEQAFKTAIDNLETS